MGLRTISNTKIGDIGNIFPVALIFGALTYMYAPTFAMLDQAIWSQDGQGHGPIMICLAIWLAWQRRDVLKPVKSNADCLFSVLAFLLGYSMYLVGSSQSYLELEVASLLFVLAAIVTQRYGLHALGKMWFPFLFLFLIVPLPGTLVQLLTAPLKEIVSIISTHALYSAGYPIGRTGVMLTIGQYQLLVADACAGLNSIFALEAVGVFYLSLLNDAAKWRRVALAMLILPISVAANVTRVIVLVLVTYYFGDEAGQGFVHDFAGILLFVVATVLTIGFDYILSGIQRWKAKGRHEWSSNVTA